MLNALLELLELSLLELLAMWLMVVVAAVIRGYAGLGFSAIVVASLSLITPTKEIVPLVLLMEVIASLQMFPKVWKDINWRLVGWIFMGSVVFIPLGQLILNEVALEPMRVVCALTLLLGVFLIAKGHQFNLHTPSGWALTGVISGVMNGMLATGGMWVAILLLGSTIKINVLRASLTALFFTTGIYASATAAAQGITTMSIVWRVLFTLPFLFVGVWLGSRNFAGTSDKIYRRVVLVVLTLLAMLLLVRAVSL